MFLKINVKTKIKNLKKDQKYAAVIIEPREKEIFELVLYNFMYFYHMNGVYT